MNLFKKAFTGWKYQFRAAVKAQDAAEVANLLDRMHVPLEEREMTLLAEEASRDVLATYFEKVKDKGGWGWTFPPINHCLQRNLFDRVDLMLGMGIDFNREDYRSHPLREILRRREDVLNEERFYKFEHGMEIPSFERRTRWIPYDKEKIWLEKMTAGGIGRIHEREEFLQDAIKAEYPEALALFIELGLDPCARHEKALRLAALLERGPICRHLIEKHGADIDGVIADARRLTECFDVYEDEKNEEFKIIFFLTKLRNEMGLPLPEEPAPEKEPDTVEAVSEEVRKLRETVAELTRKIAQLENPVAVRLDKPSQKMQP